MTDLFWLFGLLVLANILFALVALVAYAVRGIYILIILGVQRVVKITDAVRLLLFAGALFPLFNLVIFAMWVIYLPTILVAQRVFEMTDVFWLLMLANVLFVLAVYAVIDIFWGPFLRARCEHKGETKENLHQARLLWFWSILASFLFAFSIGAVAYIVWRMIEYPRIKHQRVVDGMRAIHAKGQSA